MINFLALFKPKLQKSKIKTHKRSINLNSDNLVSNGLSIDMNILLLTFLHSTLLVLLLVCSLKETQSFAYVPVMTVVQQFPQKQLSRYYHLLPMSQNTLNSSPSQNYQFPMKKLPSAHLPYFRSIPESHLDLYNFPPH